MFLILFVTTGIGNGSTYRMIPSIFREEKLRKARGKGDAGRALALKAASIESGAALGFIGAIGACGGYLIPRGFGKSIAAHRRSAAGAGGLSRVLRDLPRAHLVVLPAQEPADVGRAEPRRSARVRQARAASHQGGGIACGERTEQTIVDLCELIDRATDAIYLPLAGGGINQVCGAAARRRPKMAPAQLARRPAESCWPCVGSCDVGCWSHSRSSRSASIYGERRPPFAQPRPARAA